MGKKQMTHKKTEERPPVPTPGQGPPPPTPAAGMISTDAVIAMILASNPNADVSTIRMTLDQLTVATSRTPLQPNLQQSPSAAEEPQPSNPSPTVPNPTEPLTVTPISAYRLPADREVGEEGYAGESAEEDDATAEEHIEVAPEDVIGEEVGTSGKAEVDLEDKPVDGELKETPTTEHAATESDLEKMVEEQGIMTEEELVDLMKGVDETEEVNQ